MPLFKIVFDAVYRYVGGFGKKAITTVRRIAQSFNLPSASAYTGADIERAANEAAPEGYVAVSAREHVVTNEEEPPQSPPELEREPIPITANLLAIIKIRYTEQGDATIERTIKVDALSDARIQNILDEAKAKAQDIADAIVERGGHATVENVYFVSIPNFELPSAI